MIDVIITLDYEIFGNGTGDVIKHIIQPTSRLLEICDRYNAKLTIMFEIGEYWAFKKAESDGKLENLGYSPSGLMERQAKDAIKRGHDVQLHLHPQWIGSEYINGYWKLNFDFWRLPNLPHGLGSKDDIYSIKGALYKGKNDLEKMLKYANGNYECMGFRAGGWCIQPEKNVINAMKDTRILADTSVVKGDYTLGLQSFYDYRNAKSNYGYWFTKNNDINSEGEPNEGIIEIPIYSVKRRKIHKYKTQKINTIIKMRKNQGINPYKELYINKTRLYKENIAVRLKNEPNIFTKVPIKWDFCKLSYRDIYQMLIKGLQNYKNSNFNIKPLIMIGHSKNFFYSKNFEKFLEMVQKKYINQVEFSTLQEITMEIMNRIK